LITVHNSDRTLIQRRDMPLAEPFPILRRSGRRPRQR
jgi:hypothetical protein